MTVLITFDLSSTTDGNDRTRIRLAFLRLGWETVGGSAYRYPPLNPNAGNMLNLDDWFNHVVPALMYMRSLVESNGIQVTNFTIDSFSSTGARAGVGPVILPSANILMQPNNDPVLSEQRLREWIRDCSVAT